MVRSWTKRRFQCRRFGHGSGWIRSIRDSDAFGSQARSSAASPDVRFAADEAGRREVLRFRRKMLAAAEADLEPQIVDGGTEDLAGIRRCCAVDGERKTRQQLIDQLGLVLPELVALAASEEGALAVLAIGI